jgi:hypothetical protein
MGALGHLGIGLCRRDHTLAYQYAPQGVPRLALRRTPPDELVVAPYATALAAQLAPRLALANFGALQALGARGALRLHRGAGLHARPAPGRRALRRCRPSWPTTRA